MFLCPYISYPKLKESYIKAKHKQLEFVLFKFYFNSRSFVAVKYSKNKYKNFICSFYYYMDNITK